MPAVSTRLALLPTIGPAALRASLSSWLGSRPCRDVRVESDDSLTVRLEGRVENAAARAALRQRAIAAGAVSVDDAGVAAVGEPFCGLLDGLARYADNGPAPTLSLDRTDGVYQAGEEPGAVVRVPAQAGTSYLYVFALNGTGQVDLLLPNALDWRTQTAGGDERRLGSADPRARSPLVTWPVHPPYGPEMVIALLSPHPLDALATGTNRTVSTLLDTLNHAMRRGSTGGGIAVSWQLLEVRARRRRASASGRGERDGSHLLPPRSGLQTSRIRVMRPAVVDACACS
jgi:hypothetical protein